MYLTKDECDRLQELSKDDASYQIIVKLLKEKLASARKMADANFGLYQHVVEHSRDFVQRLNLEGRFLYVNPAFARMWGLPVDEIVGKTNEELGVVDDALLEHFRQARQIVYETGEELSIEFMLQDNICYRAQLIPEFDMAGEVDTILAIVRDISEQKRTELDLSRYKDWLRKAHEVGGIGSWEANLETGATFWSDEFYRICGLTPQSIEPSTELGFSIIHPDDRQRAAAAVEQSQVFGAPYHIEKRIVHPDGEVRWVESRGEFVVDEETQTQKLIGTFVDITERKNTEIALEQSEARYRSILSTMSEGVVLQDNKGNMLMCNDATIEILGMSRDELLAHFETPSKWELFGEDGHQLPVESYPARVTLRTGEAQSNVLMGIHHAIKNEFRWLNINTRALKESRDAQPFGVVMTIDDVTEERQARENALRARIEAERAGLLAKFTQMASHEFRTPLSIIGTNAYLLSRLQEEDRRQVKIQQINEQVAQLNRLIDVQLLMSKLDSGVAMHCMRVSLKELLSYVISDCSNKFEQKNLSVQHDIIPANLAIVADYTHFREAIYQLVDNAIRYSHDGGTITIHAYHNQSQVIVAIADEGIGISADEMPFIFNRFWRKDTAHTEAGFGLGLSLAQKIVALHGGEIEVESEAGKGTTFQIVLPI